MNKDNLLFLMGGLLVGFVTAYVLFEAMASRQPPRLTPQMRAMIVSGEEGGAPMGNASEAAAGGEANAPAANGGGGQGGAPMAQIQQLRDYVEKNPNDANAVRQLADLNFEIQSWQRAQELYDQYLKLKPKDPDVLTDLGITYRNTGNFDKALSLFQEARQIDPNHWKSCFNEVVVLGIDLKRYDEADRALAELQKMQPGNPDVARLADALSRQRKAA